jgi:hypothetical protein
VESYSVKSDTPTSTRLSNIYRGHSRGEAQRRQRNNQLNGVRHEGFEQAFSGRRDRLNVHNRVGCQSPGDPDGFVAARQYIRLQRRS